MCVCICAGGMYQPDGNESHNLEVHSTEFDYYTPPHDKADVMVALATVRGSSYTTPQLNITTEPFIIIVIIRLQCMHAVIDATYCYRCYAYCVSVRLSVCLSVRLCVLGIQVSCAKIAKPIEMLFWRQRDFLHFYPRDAMLARVLAVVMCLSVCVCLSVCLSHAGIASKRLKHRITQKTPRDSTGALFF